MYIFLAQCIYFWANVYISGPMYIFLSGLDISVWFSFKYSKLLYFMGHNVLRIPLFSKKGFQVHKYQVCTETSLLRKVTYLRLQFYRQQFKVSVPEIYLSVVVAPPVATG